MAEAASMPDRPTWFDRVGTIWRARLERPSDKLILLAIMSHANTDGEAWPGVGTIARMCGMGTSTIRERLQAMKVAAVLDKVAWKREDGGATSNRMVIRFDTLTGLVPRVKAPTPPPPESGGAPLQNPEGPPSGIRTPPPPESGGAPLQNPDGGGRRPTCLEQSSVERSSVEGDAAGETRGPAGIPKGAAVEAWRRKWSDLFCDAWRAKYGTQYAFDGAKDSRALGKCHQHLRGDDEAWARAVERYMALGDPVPTRLGHPLTELAERVRALGSPNAPAVQGAAAVTKFKNTQQEQQRGQYKPADTRPLPR